MRVVIIGANGQLAYDLAAALNGEGHEVIGLDVTGDKYGHVDVTDLASCGKALPRLNPTVVINTSAYMVDEVEDNPDMAFAVNGIGPRNLALVCKDLDVPLVHMSTDYVFSGNKGTFYVESDTPDPVNVYGVSKVAGELLLRYMWEKHFIVRVSGLYGIAGSAGKGGNFVETMLRLAGEGKSLKVVSDQVLTPTSTRAAAKQIVALIQTESYGTYHSTCQGKCSWYEFAAEIFRQSGLSPQLAEQTTTESGATALRPDFSALENAALQQIGLDLMPPWQEALQEYIELRTKSKS